MADDGIKIFVYSPESTESQKLLFTHSDDGDIIDLFSGFYDATSRSSIESESYKKIAEEIGMPIDEIMYLTDNPKEAAAAVTSGMQCNLVIRKGNAELSEDDKMKYSSITSFSELVKSGNKRAHGVTKESAAEN